MDQGIAQIVAALIGLLAASGGIGLLIRRLFPAKLTPDQRRDRALVECERRLALSESENKFLHETTRAQGDYIFALRKHIAEGNPPPPPSWPKGLTAR